MKNIKVGRKCCVCDATIGEPPYTITYLSRKCLETTLRDLPVGIKKDIYREPSYNRLEFSCEEYKKPPIWHYEI